MHQISIPYDLWVLRIPGVNSQIAKTDTSTEINVGLDIYHHENRRIYLDPYKN